MVNLTDADELKKFKEWSGEVRFIPNFKLIRFDRTSLESGQVLASNTKESSLSHEIVEDSDEMDSMEME